MGKTVKATKRRAAEMAACYKAMAKELRQLAAMAFRSQQEVIAKLKY